MTGMELLMGMGHIDDTLVDEALNAERAARPIPLRQVLAAACIGLALIGGILAARHFLPSESDPGAAPIPADNVQVEQPPTPSFTPERGDAVITPSEETPTPTNAPQPQESIEPVQTDDPQLRATSAPVQTDSPQQRETATPAQTDSPQQLTPAPVQSNSPQPRETTAPVQTDSPQQQTPAPIQTSSPQSRETTAPVQSNSPQPQATPEPQRPTESPQTTAAPEPTPEPPPVEEITDPTPPPEIWALEPQGGPMPIQEIRIYPAEQSFYLSFYENNGIITLELRKYLDQPPYLDYDSDYTNVQWESSGFEMLSQQRDWYMERFSLQLSPNQPEGRMSVFTMHIMDGYETKLTRSFCGVMTDKGFLCGYNTKDIWTTYYRICCYDGEYSQSELDAILSGIEAAAEPIWEAPIPRRDNPPLTSPENDAFYDMSGEEYNGETDQ